MNTLDIKTITQINLEDLPEYFKNLRLLNYKVTLYSSLEKVYLEIQKAGSEKFFKFDTQIRVFALVDGFINYSFYSSKKIEDFKTLINCLIDKLNPIKNVENNDLSKEHLNDFILFKDIVENGSVSETLIDEYETTNFSVFNRFHVQNFRILGHSTKIYFNLDCKYYQFDKEICLEFSQRELKHNFINFCDSVISEYNTTIAYNDDVIYYNNKSIKKIKNLYSEFFI